ncbi:MULTISPECIES: hypothetical protein [Citromicrobium]|uniref:hypothetical protein n=1 Tax=Citromicrobium TaxID=72173 RepID=UPI0001DD0FC0|nr:MULTISPECIES: hypothetical protein [Citromicrobium]
MSKRNLAFLVDMVVVIIIALNALDFITIGWLIWPLTFVALIASFIVVTTPVEKEADIG